MCHWLSPSHCCNNRMYLLSRVKGFLHHLFHKQDLYRQNHRNPLSLRESIGQQFFSVLLRMRFSLSSSQQVLAQSSRDISSPRGRLPNALLPSLLSAPKGILANLLFQQIFKVKSSTLILLYLSDSPSLLQVNVAPLHASNEQSVTPIFAPVCTELLTPSAFQADNNIFLCKYNKVSLHHVST